MKCAFFFSTKQIGNMVCIPTCWVAPKKDLRHIRELVTYCRDRAKQILNRCHDFLYLQLRRCLETKRIRTHMEK